MFCMNCGSPFTASRQHARYCCEGCKKAAERSRNTREMRCDTGLLKAVTGERFSRTCAHCGKDYRSNSPRGRYCSNACKQSAYRERKTRKAVKS